MPDGQAKRVGAANDDNGGRPGQGDEVGRSVSTVLGNRVGPSINSVASRLRREFSRRKIALRIAAFYVASGAVWEFLLQDLVPVGRERLWDFAFVVIWAGPLYFLIDRALAAAGRTDAELHDARMRHASILEANPCGIILVDRAGRFAYANPESAKILGVERSDLIGSSSVDLRLGAMTAKGDPIPRERRPTDRALESGEASHGVELGWMRPDGACIVLSLNAVPLFDANGAIDGVVATFFDITERRKAEELNTRKLSLAVEQSPAGIMITDRERKVEYVNPGYTRMTGYKAWEVIGTRAETAVERIPGRAAQVSALIAAGVAWREVSEGSRKNGEPYWESVSVSPIRNADGAITHFLWVREDVTERRRAEDALRKGREKFQNLVEKIGDIVWESDESGVFTYVSPKWRDILGYEPAEVLGKPPFDFMPVSEARRVAEIARPVIAGRRPFELLECVFNHKDGRQVVLDTSGTPFFDADGTFRGWRGVSRDITERKRAERALREAEEHFRQMFEQDEEPTIIFEPDSARIRDANPAAVALFGHPKEDLLAKGLSLVTEPGQCAELEERIRAIEIGGKLALPLLPHIRKGGETVFVSLSGKSIRMVQGSRITHCTLRDITARVRMEEEARSQHAQLIHANRMASLGTVVSGVAHEINNPNNLIMFNAPMIRAAWLDAIPILEEYRRQEGEFLLGGLSFSEMREIVPKLLTGVSDASLRIKGIVATLKEFARPDGSGSETLVDVAAAIGSSVAILNHEILKKCANFRVETGDSLPRVRGSAQQLEQVMVNLILNALQALPDKRRGIRVSTSAGPDGSTVEIRIADEGSGMSAQVMSRLTEPFFTTRSDTGGLGLGLSISSSIVKAHQGTLTFESEVGRGTTACIRLPAAQAAALPVRCPRASAECR